MVFVYAIAFGYVTPVAIWPVGFFLLIGLITGAFAIPKLARAYWLMRVMEDGLVIRFSGKGMFIPDVDVRSMRLVRERRVYLFPPQKRVHNHWQHIELQLTERAARLAEELLATPQRDFHDPSIPDPDSGVGIRLTEEGWLRIPWRGPDYRIVPAPAATIDLLKERIDLEAEAEAVEPYANAAYHGQLDEQFVELCERGESRKAVRIARERYGLSLAEAMLFVEDKMRELRSR